MAEIVPLSSPPLRRKRAPVACTECHARKIRCSVASSGQPCFNCRQDDTECILHISARGKRRGPRSSKQIGERGPDAALPTPRSSGSTVPESSSNTSNMEPTLAPPDNEWLMTPSDDPRLEEEELEPNVAGYSEIVETSRGGRGAETHIYVGKSPVTQMLLCEG